MHHGNRTLTYETLSDVYRLVQQQLEQHERNVVVVVWESFTPWFVHYGWSATRQLLHQLSNLKTAATFMQIWPIRVDALTTNQHASLEHLAQGLLWLHQGEMTMIRQGLRERGNIVRQTLPFHMEYLPSDGHYRLIETGHQHHQQQQQQKQQPTGIDPKTGKSLEMTEPMTASVVTPARDDDVDTVGIVTPRVRSKKSTPDSIQKATANTQPVTEQNPNRPRIYLQEDDPEFDDLDEEDPDDDLDI